MILTAFFPLFFKLLIVVALGLLTVVFLTAVVGAAAGVVGSVGAAGVTGSGGATGVTG